VSEQQRQAAEIFREYLLDLARQNMAIDYYLRPVDENIVLRDPLTLQNGTDPRVTRKSVVALDSPSAQISEAIKDVFLKTKKKATVVLVIDTSGSMEGEKIKNAVESSVHFVSRLAPDDMIYVIGFGGSGPYDLGGGRSGDVSETLATTLNGLYAGGGTPLYDSICLAVNRIDEFQVQDASKEENRLYGIVLLSDGDDTASSNTVNQMFSCLPSGESVEGVKIFTIAYGEDANTDLMLRIANRTNGKMFEGDPASIEDIYIAISAEQ